MATSYSRHEESDSSDCDISWSQPNNMEYGSKIKGEEMWDVYSTEQSFTRRYGYDEEAMVKTLFEDIPHVSAQGSRLQATLDLDYGQQLHRPRERQRDSVRTSPEKSIARERSTVDSAGNITLMTETVYKCNKCEKTFFTRSGYRKHQRNHSEENSYVCNSCGETFVDWPSFSEHKDSHTGGRPWACTTCDKRFRLQSHLTRHERTHTGERPYACNMCGKCFGQSSNLSSHMRIHREGKAYVRMERAQLVLHTTLHTMEKGGGKGLEDVHTQGPPRRETMHQL
ncbi:uncharacterized protein RCH25_044141 [Pelodytes ibericus]